MHASRRQIKINGSTVVVTPQLTPSFSSKGFPEVQKIIETTEETISESILVSAYDIHYGYVPSDIGFPALIYLDSGGYEASKETEFSDLGYVGHVPQEWDADKHIEIVKKWSSSVPTVFVSYDHPKARCSLDEQIDRAKLLYAHCSGGRELLIKPETATSFYVDIESIIKNVRKLSDFDVIGLTEKELGKSILDRMVNIARVRNALDSVGLRDTPIHIFGSLDTVVTPMYFLAGADIFDGLTWLRFAYQEGMTTYIHNYSAIKLGLQTKDQLAMAQVWFNNYYYLRDLELSMHRFLNAGLYSSFKYHSELYEQAYQALLAKL